MMEPVNQLGLPLPGDQDEFTLETERAEVERAIAELEAQRNVLEATQTEIGEKWEHCDDIGASAMADRLQSRLRELAARVKSVNKQLAMKELALAKIHGLRERLTCTKH